MQTLDIQIRIFDVRLDLFDDLWVDRPVYPRNLERPLPAVGYSEAQAGVIRYSPRWAWWPNALHSSKTRGIGSRLCLLIERFFHLVMFRFYLAGDIQRRFLVLKECITVAIVKLC